MLTVLSWLWTQPGSRTTYTADHVNIWADMVRRHLTMDHEIAIVAEDAHGIDESIRIIEPPRCFEDVSIPTWDESRGFPQCLRRLSMYRPDAAEVFGERFVSMDLDCVIAGSLDPLFDVKDDFKIYSGTSDTRPYNGSMQLMTAGARSRVYTEFTAAGAAEAGRNFVGSDQAWISHTLGWGESTWGPQDGVVWWGSSRNSLAPMHRLMFFPGTPKPWDLFDRAWIKRHYCAAEDWVAGDAPMIIKNNLNSPQQIMTDSGPLVLGPNEKVEISGFAPGYEGLYLSSAFLSVIDPLDHDGDGEKGGFNTSGEPVKKQGENEHVAPKRRGRPPKKAA